MLPFSAAVADLPAIADLVNSAYRGESARRGWTHEADYMGGHRVDAETLARDLAAKPAARLLGFRDEPEGELVGCVWLEPAELSRWYLGMLSVRPELQDRKLGRTILDAAERIAQDLGARAIRMTVIDIRDTLIAWYGRRGYEPTGERLPFPYDDASIGNSRIPDLAFVVLEKTLSTSDR